MHDLSMPAYAITRDWSIAAFNEGALQLYRNSGRQESSKPQNGC
jgi:hypothetical protein